MVLQWEYEVCKKFFWFSCHKFGRSASYGFPIIGTFYHRYEVGNAWKDDNLYKKCQMIMVDVARPYPNFLSFESQVWGMDPKGSMQIWFKCQIWKKMS